MSQSPRPAPAPAGHLLRVARTMGDSLLEIHHVDPSAPERRPRRAGLLAAAGALCLLVALFAFARGVSLAADNHAAMIRHTEIERRPIAEFRPARLSVAHDFFAFGGLAAGILCLGGALAARRAPRSRPRLRIGEAPEAELPWQGIDRAELVSPAGAGALRIEIPRGAEATLTSVGADGVTEAAEVGGSVILTGGERLRIERGASALSLEWTAAPRRGHLAPGVAVEARTLSYLGGSALGFALLLALIWRIPPEGRSFAMDEIGSDTRLVALAHEPAESPLAEPETEPDRGDDGGEERRPVELASSGEAGTRGTPEASRDRGRMLAKKRSENILMTSYDDLSERVKTMGALGVVRANRTRFASLTSTSPFASGIDDRDVYGGLYGEPAAIAGPWGPWGSEASFSNSPYAADWGTIRSGKLPGGGDTGESYSLFGGDGRPVRGRRHKLPTVQFSDAQASCSVAGCDKDIIRRTIKRHRARFRHCYEKSLLADPALHGTVETRFVISPEGVVQGVRAGGIGNGELEGCVGKVIASIRFPRISGGIPASVKYPFRFYPAGH